MVGVVDVGSRAGGSSFSGDVSMARLGIVSRRASSGRRGGEGEKDVQCLHPM